MAVIFGSIALLLQGLAAFSIVLNQFTVEAQGSDLKYLTQDYHDIEVDFYECQGKDKGLGLIEEIFPTLRNIRKRMCCSSNSASIVNNKHQNKKSLSIFLVSPTLIPQTSLSSRTMYKQGIPTGSNFECIVERLNQLIADNTQMTFVLVFPQLYSEVEVRGLFQDQNLKINIPINIGLFLLFENKILSVYTWSGTRIYDEVSMSQFKTVVSSPGYFPGRHLRGTRLNVVKIPDEIIDEYQHFGSYKILPKRDLFAYSGFLFYRDLKAVINFTETFVLLNDWFAYADVMTNGKVDLDIYQRIMVPKIISKVQSLHAAYASKIRLFFTKPTSLSLRNIYLAPFDPSLWLMIMITLGLVVISIILTTSWRRNLYFPQSKLDGLMCVLAALCQQGWNLGSGDLKSRAIQFSTLVTTLLLYIMYCAAIITQLTNPDAKIKDLNDVGKFGFVVGYPNKSSEMRHLQIIQDSGKFNLKTSLLNDPGKYVQAITSSRLAFLSFPTRFYDAAEAEGYNRSRLCRMSTSVLVDKIPYPEALMLRKGLPFKEIFNQKILLVKERGFYQRYISPYHNGLEIEESCNGKKVFHPVTYAHCFSAYVLVGSGMVLGIVSLILEIITKHVMTKYRVNYYKHRTII